VYLLVLKWLHLLNVTFLETILLAIAIKITQYVIEE
jgi:hypothetical protein